MGHRCGRRAHRAERGGHRRGLELHPRQGRGGPGGRRPNGRGRPELVPRRVTRRGRRLGHQRLGGRAIPDDARRGSDPDPLRRGREPGVRRRERRADAARPNCHRRAGPARGRLQRRVAGRDRADPRRGWRGVLLGPGRVGRRSRGQRPAGRQCLRPRGGGRELLPASPGGGPEGRGRGAGEGPGHRAPDGPGGRTARQSEVVQPPNGRRHDGQSRRNRMHSPQRHRGCGRHRGLSVGGHHAVQHRVRVQHGQHPAAVRRRVARLRGSSSLRTMPVPTTCGWESRSPFRSTSTPTRNSRTRTPTRAYGEVCE